MSNRMTFPVWGSPNPKVVVVAGTFTVDSAGTTATVVTGKGFTVTAAAGVHTVTFTDTYNAVIAATATEYLTEAAANSANAASNLIITSKSTTSIVITRMALSQGSTTTMTSAATALPADKGISFIAVLQNSSLAA